MEQLIIVSGILDTRNPNIKILKLRTTTEKVNLQNPVGYFLKGAPGIKTNYEDRVAYVPVSTQFIKQNNIELNCDFSKTINKECRIVIRETHYPTRIKKNGEAQEPKKIPNLPFDYYLTKDGQPIYRSYHFEIDPERFNDELIQHDPIPEEVKKRMEEERARFNNSLFNDLASSNIITEPTLDLD